MRPVCIPPSRKLKAVHWVISAVFTTALWGRFGLGDNVCPRVDQETSFPCRDMTLDLSNPSRNKMATTYWLFQTDHQSQNNKTDSSSCGDSVCCVEPWTVCSYFWASTECISPWWWENTVTPVFIWNWVVSAPSQRTGSHFQANLYFLYFSFQNAYLPCLQPYDVLLQTCLRNKTVHKQALLLGSEVYSLHGWKLAWPQSLFFYGWTIILNLTLPLNPTLLSIACFKRDAGVAKVLIPGLHVAPYLKGLATHLKYLCARHNCFAWLPNQFKGSVVQLTGCHGKVLLPHHHHM